MKQLALEFVKNCDKNGNNKFTQLRREGDVALYRRETLEGHLVGYEVFRFKTILKGTPGRGGIIVDEDYESYPGGKAFGRCAWFIGGKDAETRSMTKFTELVTGKVEVIESDEDEDKEIEGTLIPVVRISVVSEAPVKDGFQWPNTPFTQKQLASFNGFENYKVVYSDLMKGLSRGIIKVVGTKQTTNGKGKPAKIFVRV